MKHLTLYLGLLVILHNLQQIAVHLSWDEGKDFSAHLGGGAVLFILLHGEEGQAQEAGSIYLEDIKQHFTLL